jgi:hypothetical protein
MEPGSGTGVFCAAAHEVFPTVEHRLAIDIRRVKAPQATEQIRGDYVTWHTPRRFDLIATNPPYSDGEKFITKSIELLAPGGLCLFLLRLDFLASAGRTQRGLWAKAGLRAVWVIPQRIKFITGTNGDRYSSGWFVFDGRPRGGCRLGWID